MKRVDGLKVKLSDYKTDDTAFINCYCIVDWDEESEEEIFDFYDVTTNLKLLNRDYLWQATSVENGIELIEDFYAQRYINKERYTEALKVFTQQVNQVNE